MNKHVESESARFGPYKRLHRRLRGYYRFVLPLALITGLGGAMYGWQKAVPVYRAEGLIHVANSLPRVMNETDQNGPLQMFEEFVESQVLLMQSHHVVNTAIQDTDFQKALRARPMSPELFATELTVEHPARTQAIDVTFTDPDPVLATQAVKSVVSAFLESYGRNDSSEEAKRTDVLQQRKVSLQQQIVNVRKQLAQVPPPSVVAIAMVDENMRNMLQEQTQLENQLDTLQAQYGGAHAAVINTAHHLDELRQQIEVYRKEFTQMEAATAAVPQEQRRVATLPEFLGFQEQMDQLRADLIATVNRIDVLNTEGSMGNARFSVLSNIDVPSAPYSDRRIRMAGIFGIVGAGIPIGLFLLFGLFDRRFRHSDDTVDAAGDVPLLGVLPVLPNHRQQDDLARIAAYCVHNLRVRLQLLGKRDDRPVYMITSAAAGEGKTSLTLALGMAFATSAKRTLLIDCDPIGRGLTHRMQMDNQPGVLDSCKGTPMSFAVSVAPNLDLLPAGNGDEFRNDAGFNWEELEHLVSQARQQYDVVLIDTGPVMASLQAPVVAQVADYVVMTISEGMQETMVDRSMKLLKSVGIQVAGFVFNRASARDYNQWIGGASYYAYASKDRALNRPTEITPYGPLADSMKRKQGQVAESN
ncbi:MAG: AAA family ATPase [Phycisphaerae bacterium]|nr:AAA family ATPase [Phycisphaerae bacterium]